jgi:hypothetical protein
MSVYLRKYATATTIDFALYKLDGTGLKTDAASATGDVTLYRDEAGVETLDADAFVDEGAIYSLALSEAEMTASRIIVAIVDQSSPQVWLDKTLIVETYGNASAQHAFDLDTATQAVNVTQIGGAAQSATDFKDLVDTGYDPATHKVQGVVLCDTTTTNTDMLTAAAVNAEVDTALNTAIPAVNTADSINDILLDTLGTDVWATAARTLTAHAFPFTNPAAPTALANLTVGTVTTLTTWDKAGYALSAAGIDSIWDEVIEGAAPTARQAMRLYLSALSSKLSGAGTGTLAFRDYADSKDRITATVDANNNRTAIVTDVT